MKRISTFRIVIAALFAALICVATMLVQIPIPATGGYANLGDGIVLICAFLMNPLIAILAAGLGSMLADLLAGYVSFAFGTLVIKAGVACIAALVFRHWGKGKSTRQSLAAMIAAGILAEAFMVLGYFAYEAIILGMGLGAAGAIVGNIGQGVVGVIIACVVSPVLMRSREIEELMNRT